MDTLPLVKLKSTVEVTDTTPAYHILRFPKAPVAAFEFKGNLRRVICMLTAPCNEIGNLNGETGETSKIQN